MRVRFINFELHNRMSIARAGAAAAAEQMEREVPNWHPTREVLRQRTFAGTGYHVTPRRKTSLQRLQATCAIGKTHVV